ncbi:MAG: dihydroorotate dehydrogenase B catalytic subunit [Nitrospirae bacterium RIFCSPLOW2_12_42_9]|nr:MAG: dihydroorotate dehydrogenase B catalytic subunit [Nitrospirae bacterium GWA2_42_11]OGW57264.1 MAG: dihydroorotate dehydrogenase B catalytic subunit [Nitrospirae bacterium RIFCSPLOW2_12_42_9]OGW58261.1 MAG: dihydroorotate dehydrogenase B catalytic subunit [Nitrospirae bacterium RIFCSPHIGHO2_02_FULL_42_12]HBI23087.1 dihydroorotate dehydrogenase [Nitrospiraceae bacterium]
MKPDLSIRIAGIDFQNPVTLASGTARYGEEITEHCDLNRLGAIIVKGIALKPTPGNPPPRICETPSGMLNAIGLPNIGVDAFIRDKLPFLRQFNPKVLVNIFGSTVDEYGEVARRFNGVAGVHGLEVNISCPNIKEGGIAFGTDIESTRRVVQIVRKATTLPVLIKLSPNVTDIASFARVCEDEGADGLSVINTLLGMSIDTETWKPRLANVTGGLSGPAIRPVAVRMVWQVYKAVKIPIIGMGGIFTVNDAVEFLLAGASAVAVGTANFINPGVSIEIVEGLEKYMEDKGLNNISELIGAIKN